MIGLSIISHSFNILTLIYLPVLALKHSEQIYIYQTIQFVDKRQIHFSRVKHKNMEIFNSKCEWARNWQI